MSDTAKLAESLNLAEVRSLAGAKTFERGQAYFHDGVVSRLEEHGAAVRATVRGTHRYQVELAVEDGGLAYECNCPVGEEGAFCKHAVAVALSWLENSGEEVFHAEEVAPGKPRKKRKTDKELICEHISTLDKSALQTLLLDVVERDLMLRDKLLLAARAAEVSDLTGMKAVVRQVTRISHPMNWEDSGAYGDSLMSLADMLRARLSGPHAAQVVELSELAIAGAEKSLEQIDDSGGYVMPAILELAAVHLDACTSTGPDPVKLAERLFRFLTDGNWDTFHNVLPAYAKPLGKNGLRRYRELVNDAWDALPTLAPSDRYQRSYDSPRMQLEHAMEGLAELDGDVDALIRIRSKDLSNPYRFLLVAELCMKHGRLDEGLAWAERGIAESGESIDQRLLDFCIDAYLRRGEFGKADARAWRRFEMHPTAPAFAALMKVATATGRHDEIREQALTHLRALVTEEEAAEKSKHTVGQSSTRSELVRIFIAEKENDKAWETFNGGPVGTRLWPDMAVARGKTHPHDAIVLYHRLLPVAVQAGTCNARYDEAFDVVRAIGMLRTKLGEQAEFAGELEGIRTAYRAKRNFIKLLATLA